jgi:hypothetical protein
MLGSIYERKQRDDGRGKYAEWSIRKRPHMRTLSNRVL